MAFNIVKHRRGTTSEWLEFDLVPEEGELVIEECKDGSHRCKIGDGHNKFSKLAYLDRNTELKLAEILKSLNDAKNDFNRKISSINATNKELSNNQLDLAELINKNVSDLSASFKLEDTKLLAAAQQYSDDKVLNAINQSFKHTDEVTTDKINSVKKQLQNQIKSENSLVEQEFIAKFNEHKTNTELEFNNLEEKLTECITSETNKAIEHFGAVEQEIKKIDTELNQTIQSAISNLDKKISTKTASLSAQHSDDFKNLSKSVATTVEELDTKISQHAVETTEAISAKADAVMTVLDKKLNAAVEIVQSKIGDVESTSHKDLQSAKMYLEKLIVSNKDYHIEALTKLKAELSEIDLGLLDKIVSLSQSGQQNENTIKTLVSQLAALDTKVQQFKASNNSLAEMLYEVEYTLNNITADLNSQITALTAQHNTEYADVISRIETTTEMQSAYNAEIMSTMLNYVTKIYVELEDLVDDDILILTKVFSLNNKLSDRLSEVETNLNSDIRNVESDLNTKITSVEKSLADEVSLVKDTLTSSINTTASSLNTKLNEAKQALTEDITKKYITLVDKVEAAREELSDSITNTEDTLRDQIQTSKAALTENVENLRSNTNLKFNEIQKDITNITEVIQDNKTYHQTQLGILKTDLQQADKDAQKALLEFGEQVSSVSSRIDQNSQNIATQANRISRIIALQSGSTTGDIELADIRTGYNGLEHSSAGDAVRAIGNDLEELKNSLPDYIPANAVDGLLYEDNLLYLTSDGVPVSDPVEITGGSGGTGSISVVKVTNNLATNFFTAAKGNEAWIDFTYTSFENEVPTGDGTVLISINNKKIEALSGNIQHGVPKRLNIANYLKVGSNTVRVTCSDQYGASRSLVYNISIIELKIESSFDSSRIFDDTIIFRYKIFGQIEKTVHILVDGEEFYTKVFTSSVSGAETTLTLPKQTHGVHKITAYITSEVEDSEIYSNTLEFEIVCTEAEHNEAILASVYEVTEVTQGDLVSIPFMLFDPAHTESTVELIIYSQVAGTSLEIDKKELNVDRSLQFWKTRSYPAGKVLFVIKYTYMLYGEEQTISKTHVVDVQALDVDISAETDSLQLFLTAHGRSNNEQNPAQWSYIPTNALGTALPEITTTFQNFNWKSNGWVDDGTGDTCLRLNGDARATVNFKPFQNDFKLDGKTIEFEFAVRDINNREAIVIDCYNGDRGFRATSDTAFLQSSGTKVSCRYKDNERIRVAVSVEHADSISRFVSIYLDGILSGVQRYETTDDFSQYNPVNITLGSGLCGLDLYAIRVYNKALPTAQMLRNYIADIAEPTTKLKLATDNDILDEAGKISYDRVKELGQLPIVTFTGQMPTYKGDKKNKSVRMKFEDPTHPELNFDVLLDQIDVQGTSSQFYARKNWKVKLPEAKQHMPGAIPAKVFCIKVDYAEATGTHNTGSANYIETLYDKEIVELPPQKDDPRVRTTIQGFPCILFEKETEDSEPVFSSKGNFNYDKDSENAFGFTENYKDFGVECWEFCNNTSDSVNFAGPIPSSWLEDFEPRYVPKSANFDRIEELQELADLTAKGEATMTDVQRQELAKLMDDCIANFKEVHDWVLSTATYRLIDGARVAIEPTPLAEAVTYGDVTYTEDNEEYRLAKFKYEFKNYFNIHYSSMYYVFTLFALMTDQRAKNMFLTRWKDSDGIHRWYPYFYDNDTIFGINNEGALVFDYYHEDIDQLGSSNVFNGQNSVLWNNFRLCFPQEIKDTYASLRNNKKLTYDAIINQFVTLGSDKWSAAVYNEDAEYKYITMARPSGPDGTVDASNLYQVRGPGEHHLRYFIANRLNYCDSKWYAGDYPSDFFFLRIYTPSTRIPLDTTLTDAELLETYGEEQLRIYKSLKAVPANSNILVTPFSNMYAGVKYKANGILQQERLSAGQSHSFGPTNVNETFNDTETAIYGASALASIGDLSGLYCGVINLAGKNTADSNADQGTVKENKLIELIIGNKDPDYYNDNFREIEVGTCRLLKKIDLRNCSGLGIAGNNPQKTLNLTGCPNIEEIYTEGTNLTTVSLPESGYVKKLHLPASLTNLNIKNQHYITDFSIESYANIKTLCIENCPTLDTNEILNACKSNGTFTVERVRLTGINWTLPDASFIKTLYPKFDSEGNLIGGIRGLDDKNNNVADAYLVGTCHIDKLSGAEYSEIKQHYPYLDITFNEMTSTVIFKDLNDTEVYRESLTGFNSATVECTDPVSAGKISLPYKESTVEFDFEWVGWTRTLGGDYQADALLNIAGNRTLYPAFKAIRRSYEVTFINSTDKDNSILQKLMVEYGSDAIYTGMTPIKQDAANPELYAFIGWYPSPEKITGPLTCDAQFTVRDDKWYTINIGDISDFEDSDGNLSNGYTLDQNNKTMTITNCKNKFNVAIRIPASFSFVDELYTVTQLGGFASNKTLDLLSLPDTLIAIMSRAFQYCSNLSELNWPQELKTVGAYAFRECIKLKDVFIPESVTEIGEGAFAGCAGIVRIEVDPKNTKYIVNQGCLVNTSTGEVIRGLSTGTIPQDGTIKALLPYCFDYSKITTANIPEGVKSISQNAFSHCASLTELTLPSTLEELDATCFAWCSSLKNVILPEGLTTLKTYVFDACAIENIIIPASVNSLFNRSFGDMSSLKTVTFKKCVIDGEVKIPDIHEEAFANSGSSEGLVFRLPWSADIETKAPWGAKNCTIIYDYEETD